VQANGEPAPLPVGTTASSETRRRRPANRYELVTCAWRGHVLVGTDSAQVSPDDALVVREEGGLRWHRCLRCDSWELRPIPQQPGRDTVESREEIELPLRGPSLRDRYVLRLIALDRAIHVIVLGTLAFVLLAFASHHSALENDYHNLMTDLAGGDPGSTQVRGVLGYLGRAFKYSPAHLTALAFVLLAYAALEATEMVGLWLAKRWAEYLTFVATVILIPYEIYELSLRVSVFKVIVFVINVAVAVYLLFAKRLFGLRGGQRAERARREASSGWVAIERATVAPEKA
jgi:uncharacterized membrane protein (DUF2068 family)